MYKQKYDGPHSRLFCRCVVKPTAAEQVDLFRESVNAALYGNLSSAKADPHFVGSGFW